MFSKTILVGALALMSTLASAHFDLNGPKQIVRFKLNSQIKRFLKVNDYDVAGVNYRNGTIDALLTDEQVQKLKAMKADFTFSYPQNLLMAPDKRYKNPQEIEEFVKDIAGRYPQIATVKSIGKSLEGRDIWAIKISDNAKKAEKEPAVFVNGMHHAREVMTPEITTDMIEYLLTNYNVKDEVTKWVNETEIWVIPMFNVDGNNKMWTTDSMWRKNVRGGYGVDINRNYPYAWNSCGGSSGMQWAQDYRGASAGSEPETQAMMNFVASIKPVFSISYHSYSELVIYPFGCSRQRTPAEEAVETIGKEIATKIGYKPGTSWEVLYNVDGGDIDWLYATHQVIPYVIEVNDDNAGFHPNYDKLRDKTVERNRAGWMHLLERMNGPGIHGVVPNKSFNTIKISRAGEGKVVQTYKVNPDGSFHIIVKPGKYDLSFEGAETKVIPQIDVQSKYTVNF